ncbi:MAG: preQ(1) synthase [Chitinispirillaceae bacterium]|nr:preQ(1) synthase [Chitinispirillaceae bacterium]
MFFDNVISLEASVTGNVLPPLETFPCPYDTSAAKSGVIRIVFPEFTCVCPKTGYPDFASIGVWYLPDRLCIELKSWKLYLNAFRMVGAFHEALTHHLYATLEEVLKPAWLLVAGDFFPRGNVDATVVFESPSSRPKGVDLLIAPLRERTRGFDGHE